MVAVMYAQLNSAPPAHRGPAWPFPQQSMVIARGMAKDLAARYGSVGEPAAAIVAATADHSVMSIPAPTGKPPAVAVVDTYPAGESCAH
jgi:hypothetical protein